MPTYRVAKDMFQTDAEVLVNTTNVVGVMGAGIALEFKKRYPAMFEEYRKRCNAGLLKPGELDVHMCDGKVIVNFSTKRHWRDPSEYGWVRNGLYHIKDRFAQSKLTKLAIGIPGAGLGGLDPETVLYFMGEIFATLPESKIIYIPELPPQVRDL